jgi:hypothetical protein
VCIGGRRGGGAQARLTMELEGTLGSDAWAAGLLSRLLQAPRHTYILACARTHTYTRARARARARTHARTCTHMHARTHARTHTHLIPLSRTSASLVSLATCLRFSPPLKAAIGPKPRTCLHLLSHSSASFTHPPLPQPRTVFTFKSFRSHVLLSTLHTYLPFLFLSPPHLFRRYCSSPRFTLHSSSLPIFLSLHSLSISLSLTHSSIPLSLTHSHSHSNSLTDTYSLSLARLLLIH